MRRRDPGCGRGGCAPRGRYQRPLDPRPPNRRGTMLGAMAKPVLSDAIQDYLKEIYKLGASGDRVTVTALSRAVGVSAPSASTMLKKLDALGLLEHQPYRGVRLTSAGEQVALEVIRHHRLLEL